RLNKSPFLWLAPTHSTRKRQDAMNALSRDRLRLVALLLVLAAATPASGQTARELAQARSMMVGADVASAGIKNPAVLAVLRAVPRHEFVPADVRPYAYLDMALPIGHHQTISPPFIVGYMTAQLDPRPDEWVLEIGTGSGYQAAVLGSMVR